ncbi:MAG TPA: methyltransferase domain-containing protein [Acidimicrobiales bacterium]|nr:methyltransferase domain-containing protein [Acidimicrobiales bacterium]
MTDNIEMREYWDRRAELWDRRATALEGASDPYGESALMKLNLQPGERVIDIGCGPGAATITIAGLVGPKGEAVGIDISTEMIKAAEARAKLAGVDNTKFVVADAQTDPLGTGFDAVFSRFGVMFFPDPAAAFTNIVAALHPGGRLAAMAWGPVGANPWMFLPTMTAAQVLGADLPLPDPGAPGPFSLADDTLVDDLLTRAGFRDINIDVVEGKREIGDVPGVNDVRVLLETCPLAEPFLAADDDTQQRVIDALTEAFAPYKTDGGWAVPGMARCITAVRGSA